MKNNFYLIRLEINGIKNIEKPIELNFYKKIIENDFDPSNYKVKAIFGENGSGKTAIIVAVNILKNVLSDENYLFDTETQKILVECVNKYKKEGYIECEFIWKSQEKNHIGKYRLEFAIRDSRRFYIVSEQFQIKNGNYSKNKYKTVFETRNGELLSLGNGNNLEHYKKITQNLLEQRSFITWLFDDYIVFIESLNNNHSIIYLIYLLIFAFSIYVYLDNEDRHLDYFRKKRIEELATKQSSDESIEYFRKEYTHILRSSFDTNIIPKDDFPQFQRYIYRMYLFLKIFKPDLKGIEIEKKDTSDSYKCDLILVYEHYKVNQELESRGIKKLISLFDYLDASSNGMISFIDELDSNINDVYLDKLIEYFMWYGNGQLCFTSHNLSPMTILNKNKCSISFISGINTVHNWIKKGNESPENAYRNGFIMDSPFNIDATDFIGVLGGTNNEADTDVLRNQ